MLHSRKVFFFKGLVQSWLFLFERRNEQQSNIIAFLLRSKKKRGTCIDWNKATYIYIFDKGKKYQQPCQPPYLNQSLKKKKFQWITWMLVHESLKLACRKYVDGKMDKMRTSFSCGKKKEQKTDGTQSRSLRGWRNCLEFQSFRSSFSFLPTTSDVGHCNRYAFKLQQCWY